MSNYLQLKNLCSGGLSPQCQGGLVTGWSKKKAIQSDKEWAFFTGRGLSDSNYHFFQTKRRLAKRPASVVPSRYDAAMRRAFLL
jgi:hypothetical protein